MQPRTGRTHQRHRFCKPGLEERMVAEHARPYNGPLNGAFGLGECHTGFHRTLRDAQGYRTDRQPEYADEGEPGQGPW